MKLEAVRPFNLGTADFDSGKMLAPPRDEWIKCEICGKRMYKGFELNNGARIGKECELALHLFNAHKIVTEKARDFWSITKKQFAYFMEFGV